MPTQRTMFITLTIEEQHMIRAAVLGMEVANRTPGHAGHNEAYGGFYDAIQRIISVACYGDPDLMELWNSNTVQSSLDITDSASYCEQIKSVLAEVGNVHVTLNP